MNENLLWAGGAAVAGIVLGYLLSDTSGPRLLINEKNETVQAELSSFAQVSEAMAVLSAKVDALEADLAANQDAVSALGAELSDRLTKVETGASAMAETLDALSLRSASAADRLSGLSERSASNADAIAKAGDALAAMADAVRALGDNRQASSETAPRVRGGALVTPVTPVAPLETGRMDALAKAEGLELTVGQTGTVQDYNLFLSRVDETTARLLVVQPNGGRATVVLAADQPQRLGTNCEVALTRLVDRTAELIVACAKDGTTLAAVATEVVATAAPPEAVPEPEAKAPLADKLSIDGLALGIGQTGRTGDTRFFVRRLRDNAVELQIIGGRRFTLGADQPEDLGNGCALVLVGVDDNTAYIEPTCAE